MKFTTTTYQFLLHQTTQALYLTDRINAVMMLMTYAVLADNLHFNSLANGDVKKGTSNSGGAEWFKSGIADFVHGGDFLFRIFWWL